MQRNQNLLRVLALIGQKGPISRSQIARTLGSLPSAVTQTVNELLRLDLVREIGYSQSTGGRKPALLELKEGGHVLAGIRIVLASVQVIFMDLRANVLEEEEFDLPADTRPEALIDALDQSFKRCFGRAPSLVGRVRGIGIGIGGVVDPRVGVSVSCPGFPEWHRIDLAGKVSERLGLPTFLDNDVAMATLAELWFGAGRGRLNFVYVHLLHGIGMGVVIEGNLYTGHTGNAGELGHITFDPNGPVCWCGNTGCLETFVNSGNLLSMARSGVTHRTSSRIMELTGDKPENLKPEHVYEAARSGDRLAMTLLRRLCRPIGLTLANVVNLFDPEMLIVGGRLAEAGDSLLRVLEAEISLRSLTPLNKNVQLCLAEFGNRNTAMGGGALVLQKICEGEVGVPALVKPISPAKAERKGSESS